MGLGLVTEANWPGKPPVYACECNGSEICGYAAAMAAHLNTVEHAQNYWSKQYPDQGQPTDSFLCDKVEMEGRRGRMNCTDQQGRYKRLAKRAKKNIGQGPTLKDVRRENNNNEASQRDVRERSPLRHQPDPPLLPEPVPARAPSKPVEPPQAGPAPFSWHVPQATPAPATDEPVASERAQTAEENAVVKKFHHSVTNAVKDALLEYYEPCSERRLIPNKQTFKEVAMKLSHQYLEEEKVSFLVNLGELAGLRVTPDMRERIKVRVGHYVEGTFGQ